MKKRIGLLSLVVCFFTISLYSQICNSNGNIVLFSNYDGGTLNIDVDQNIPNLKIGIVSYETDSIVITGAFKNNIQKIWWAGYDATNNHCNVKNNTSINGAPNGTDTIVILPAVTKSNSNGNNNYIICNYSCDTTTSQGGCNTPDQIVDYFYSVFNGGTLFSHTTKYGCWTGTYKVSGGGTCCIDVQQPLSANGSVDTVCFNICNGEATAYPSGGVSPYTYSWDSNAGNQTTQTATGLCGGNYSVTITDSNSQTVTSSSSVMENSQIASATSETDNLCFGDSLGSSILTVTGGTPGYSYSWSNGSTSSNIDSLPNGTYTVTITDQLGCTHLDTATISSPDSLEVSHTTIDDLSNNCTGEATVNPVGGVTPYSYLWDSNAGNQTSQTATGLCAGSFTVTITDSNGCTIVDNNIWINPDNVEERNNEINFSLYPNPASDGKFKLIASFKKKTDIEIYVQDGTGRTIYSYHDNNVREINNEISLSQSSAGIYLVTVKTKEGVTTQRLTLK